MCYDVTLLTVLYVQIQDTAIYLNTSNIQIENPLTLHNKIKKTKKPNQKREKLSHKSLKTEAFLT